MVPSDFVGHRRNVVHAVDDGDVLVEVQYFAKLFEATVQEADIGFGIHDHFTIELQYQTQSGVRGRVLWTKIEGPETCALVGIQVRTIEQF